MTRWDNPAPLSTAPAAVRSLELQGPCGKIEAIWNEGVPSATSAVLLCHPHPLGGGSLHNKVVYHAMKLLNDPARGFGLPVLRFNFRGAGRSEGQHDGLDESRDVLAALSWLERACGLPVLVAGFSFGAAMALKALSERKTLDGLLALALLGLPVSDEFPELRNPQWLQTPLPKLFLSGDRDAFAPLSLLNEAVQRAAEPRSLALVAGADHFFTGRIDAMQEALAGWLQERLHELTSPVRS